MSGYGEQNPNWKGGKTKKDCDYCGKPYFAIPSQKDSRRFCSHLCASYWRAATVVRKEKALAKKEVKATIVGDHSRLGIAKKCPHLTKKGRFFCAQCDPHRDAKRDQSCKTCGGIYLTYNRDSLFCSRECYAVEVSKRQMGENSHLWKGGLTSEESRLRQSAKLKKWREAVMERDGYRCVNCNTTEKLTTDHILPWAAYPDFRLDVDNGRTLCWPCHTRIGDNPGQWTKEKRRMFGLGSRAE